MGHASPQKPLRHLRRLLLCLPRLLQLFPRARPQNRPTRTRPLILLNRGTLPDDASARSTPDAADRDPARGVVSEPARVYLLRRRRVELADAGLDRPARFAADARTAGAHWDQGH